MQLSKCLLLSCLSFAINAGATSDDTFAFTVGFAIYEGISADELVISTVHDTLMANVIDPLMVILKNQPGVAQVTKEACSNKTTLAIKAVGKGKRGNKKALASVESFIQTLLSTACEQPIDIRLVPSREQGREFCESQFHVIINNIADLATAADWLKQFTDALRNNHNFSSLAS